MALIDELELQLAALNQTNENIELAVQRIDSRQSFASEKGLRLLQEIADIVTGRRQPIRRSRTDTTPGRPTTSPSTGIPTSSTEKPTVRPTPVDTGYSDDIITQLISTIGLRAGPLGSIFLRPGRNLEKLSNFLNPRYTQQEATQAIARRASQNDIRRRVMADGTVGYDELGTRPGTYWGQSIVDTERKRAQLEFEEERQKEVGQIKTSNALRRKLAVGMSLLISTIILVTESLSKFQKELGGVSRSQAAKELFASLGQSLKSFFTGTFLFPGQIRQTQGAFAQEFGGLLTSGDAAQFAQVAKRAGLEPQALVGLQRALQGTGRDVEDTINTFMRSGVTSQVAAAEIQKNAGAVARAGNKFNEYIVEGIKNAKRLGLEFSQIEQTLAGYGMNFEGTVEGFAQLRSIIPGMAVDFGELLYTSVYGSTDDFIGQIRDSLNSAGITSASQLNRLQGQMLKQQTGFDEAQLDRILKGQEAGPAFQEGLDTTRNSLLRTISKILIAGFGALIGAQVGSSIASAIIKGGTTGAAMGASTMTPQGVAVGALGGALIGGVGSIIGGTAGGAAGYFGAEAFLPDMEVGDAVITPQGQVIETSPEDYLFATKTPETLVSQTSVDTKNLENQMMANTQALQEIKEMFRSGLNMNISGMEEATVQGLDYAYNRQLRS